MKRGVNSIIIARCQAPGIVYRAEYQACPEDSIGSRPAYVGTSGHNIHQRSLKHKDDIKAGTQ